MENDYECPKCHNTFPSQNKLLHDIRCSEENPMALDKNDQMKINKQINQIQKNYYNKNEIKNEKENSKQINNQKPLISESNDFNDNFICEICGKIFNESIKNDHMLCHKLENEEKEKEKEKERIKTQKLLESKEKQIEQQKKIEKQIKLQNQIEQQKKIEKQIKLQNQIEQQKKIEKQIKLQNQIQQQKRIENQIRLQNEMRRRQQNPGQRINNLNNPNIRHFFRPVKKNYDHPTDRAILNGLPEMLIDTSKLDDEKKTCMICLEEYKTGEKATTLPCIHIFHTNCIKSWLNKQNSCPICKFKLVKNNVNQ